MNAEPGLSSAPWSSAGEARRRWRFRWSGLLWQLVYPRGGGPRIAATASGTMLVALAFGIGVAAYNASNNILFITLSLLLACLILSGVMSWLNFKSVDWRLLLAPPFRADQEMMVTIELRNGKRLLPTYGLWFDVVAFLPRTLKRRATGAAGRGWLKSLWRTPELPVAPARVQGRLFLRSRLGPQEDARLDWVFKPSQRGVQRLALEGVGSLFPFGFLRKSLVSSLVREIIVWPAPVEYRWHGAAASRPQPAGARVRRAGPGTDLHALRRYEAGDSHRLIHWKASARQQQLLVRQFSAESQEAYALWVQTEAALWTRPGQFELMVGFAASLAEDLFRTGRLRTVAIDGGSPRPLKRVRDLEAFLDELAVVQVKSENGAGDVERTKPFADGVRHSVQVHAGRESGAGRSDLLTIVPDGPRGVAAYVDGKKTATA